ncbi:MAG: tandem-95 repeat protein, partial [Acidobacteria bacterium]|nr:tandem-95 repeat protein [Acidobacteriota bacterium]
RDREPVHRPLDLGAGAHLSGEYDDARAVPGDALADRVGDLLGVAAPGVLGNDSDVDGDSITAVLDTTVTNGTLTLNADGSFSYTPAADFSGTDNFSYHADDGVATSNVVTVTLTIGGTNDPPVAVDDSVTTNEDTAVTIDVLANDSDVEGTVTITGWMNPANGTVGCSTDCVYTPSENFNGFDSFTYTITDSGGLTATAMVSITVNPVNDAPVAMDDAKTTPFETPVTIPVLNNDSDVDGDPLTVLTVGTAANGTVTCTTSDCNYTPDAGFTGTDSFIYTIKDPLEALDSALVTVTVLDPTSTDITVAKSGPSTAMAGDEIQFTIVVSNVGPKEATSVRISDPTPSGLEFVSNSGNCVQPFPCLLATIESGGVRNVISTYRVSSDAPQTVTNTATLKTDTPETDTTNNSSSASVTITPPEEPECPSAVAELVAPLGGTAASPVSFTWTAVDGATGYDVLVDQGSGPVVVASTTSTSATVSLSPGATNWYVDTHFDECPSTRSTGSTFTVAGGDCIDDSPELFAPAHGASGLSSPVEFRWSAVPGASSYRVWVESDDSFPVVVGTTSATKLVATVPSGELRWYVQALFEGCPPTISEVRTIGVEAGGDCPTEPAELISPQTGAELDSPILFEWSRVDGAVRYAVWASVTGDSESIIGTTEGETSTTLERTMDAGEIEWFVEIFFGGCPSIKTSSRSFTVNEDLTCVTQAPQLMLPAAEADDVPGLVKFEWSAVPTALGYRLWAKSDGVGEFEQIGATLAETELQVPVQANMVEWYVEAVFDRCRPTRSSERRFFVRPTPNCDASKSTLLTPVGNVIVGENRVNLVWTAVDGADAYNVWVSREDGGQSKVGLTSGSELAIEVDLEEGAHEWWVTALFGSCSPLDSDHELFTVDTGVPDECRSNSELLLLAPAEGAADIVSPVIFEWSEVPGATGYQVWLLEGENDTPHPLGGVREDTQAVVQIPAGTIRWYVEAIRSGVCGPVRSAIQHFKVTPSGSACDIPDKPLVYGVGFELKPGSGIGIIGPTGAGKSTLARALVGVWPAIRGRIRIDGASLEQWDPAVLGRHIGYLP